MGNSTQDLDDIEVPVIQICDGWSVDDVKTIEDCDDAYAYLMAAVAEIEFSIDMFNAGEPLNKDPSWKPRAQRALKYKKAALQIVGWKRGRIEKARRQEMRGDRDRALLEHIIGTLSQDHFQTLCRSFEAKWSEAHDG